MAEQIFYDADVKNSEHVHNNDHQPATNISELKTFSQFNHWTLVDECDVDPVESNAEEGKSDTQYVNKIIVETLINEEASNASDVPLDNDNKPEELVWRETLLQIS